MEPTIPRPMPIEPMIFLPVPGGTIGNFIPADCRRANQLPFATVAPQKRRCAQAADVPCRQVRQIKSNLHTYKYEPLTGPEGPNPKMLRTGRRIQTSGMNKIAPENSSVSRRIGCCSVKSPNGGSIMLLCFAIKICLPVTTITCCM